MKAFEEGRSAFLTGQVGNPYPINSNKNREWERGWNKEYYANLQRIKNLEKLKDDREGKA